MITEEKDKAFNNHFNLNLARRVSDIEIFSQSINSNLRSLNFFQQAVFKFPLSRIFLKSRHCFL